MKCHNISGCRPCCFAKFIQILRVICANQIVQINVLGEQVGRHVNECTISMKLVVDFGPIHGNASMLAAALSALG